LQRIFLPRRAAPSTLLSDPQICNPQRWNPETDHHLPTNYSAADFKAGKAANKAALQQELGLPVDPDVPLLVSTVTCHLSPLTCHLSVITDCSFTHKQ
jgi:hypothetical protein